LTHDRGPRPRRRGNRYQPVKIGNLFDLPDFALAEQLRLPRGSELAVNLAEIVAGLRVAGAEFEGVEVKLAAGGVPETLASTLAAFANARGGSSSWGLTSGRGSRLTACRTRRRAGRGGVPDAAACRTRRTPSRGTARGKLTPSLAPSVEIVPFEGVNLVVAEVEPLPPAQRPCYVTTSAKSARRRRATPAWPPCCRKRETP
jgi:hypothetical protein